MIRSWTRDDRTDRPPSRRQGTDSQYLTNTRVRVSGRRSWRFPSPQKRVSRSLFVSCRYTGLSECMGVPRALLAVDRRRFVNFALSCSPSAVRAPSGFHCTASVWCSLGPRDSSQAERKNLFRVTRYLPYYQRNSINIKCTYGYKVAPVIKSGDKKSH